MTRYCGILSHGLTQALSIEPLRRIVKYFIIFLMRDDSLQPRVQLPLSGNLPLHISLRHISCSSAETAQSKEAPF